MAKWTRRYNGIGPPTGRRVDRRSTRRLIMDNCTQTSAFHKGRRDGDNPATATAAAFPHTRETVHSPLAIFEVAKPGLQAGLRVDRSTCPKVVCRDLKAEQKPFVLKGSVR